MFRVWVLIFAFFATGFARVDIITPNKNAKVHVFLFMMCGKRIAYVYNHRGRTKVVSVNGLTLKDAKILYKYINKYPVKHKIRILPGTNLPCHEQQREIAI